MSAPKVLIAPASQNRELQQYLRTKYNLTGTHLKCMVQLAPALAPTPRFRCLPLPKTTVAESRRRYLKCRNRQRHWHNGVWHQFVFEGKPLFSSSLCPEINCLIELLQPSSTIHFRLGSFKKLTKSLRALIEFSKHPTAAWV